MHSIQLSQVSFSFSGEAPVLDGVSFTIPSGVTALAGPNGAGKTTLMRLMMREISPQRGTVQWQGFNTFGWLPQSLGPAVQSSGQQKMRRLSTLFREADGALFLDEPETHLDAVNRAWLAAALRRHRGLVVIASHDPALLDSAGTILHTEMGRVTAYSMPFAGYQSMIAHEKEMRAAKVDHAEHELKKSQRERRVQLERQLRRSANAAAKAPLAGIPRIARGIMKRNAEATLGKIISKNRKRGDAEAQALHSLREERGRSCEYFFAVPVAAESFLEIDRLQIYRAENQTLWRRPLSFSAKRGEKLHIAGANGSGKSMLFKTICGQNELPHTGTIAHKTGEIRLMNSTHTGFDPAATPLMLALAEGIAGDAGSARRLLGAFGFPGDAVFRRFADLSAGEKMRLRILLIGKSPRPASVILSDEAETGLDTATRGLYAGFLNAFSGIVLAASHDAAFILSLDLTNRVVLDTNPVMG
ncbi:MAG: ABC-F family ATP-binding cassette domain-containing protein [Spirochaetes bacterium]|nr:ABC-F family ATP-binding cassette domain-containing protein [Spirochaetota bacterium]